MNEIGIIQAIYFVFGYGMHTDYDNDGIIDLIEMDFMDIFYSFGFIGILLFVIVILYFFVVVFFVFLRNRILSLKNFVYLITIILALGMAYISGHVFLTYSVSTLFCIFYSLAYRSIILSDKMKKNKIMFISSVGGHLTQLLQLKDIFNKYDYLLVTEKTEVTKDMSKKYNTKYLIYGSRQYLFRYIFIFFYNIIKSIVLFAKYRPRVIITTGTHTAVPMCYVGKLFGCKIIYIESFAKRTTPTLAGRLVYPIADTFVIQWKSMKKHYPKAVYWGWIY